MTLGANQLVITDTTRAACGWKTVYDRTWSAAEAVAAGKPELHAAVADVLVTSTRKTIPHSFATFKSQRRS